MGNGCCGYPSSYYARPYCGAGSYCGPAPYGGVPPYGMGMVPPPLPPPGIAANVMAANNDWAPNYHGTGY